MYPQIFFVTSVRGIVFPPQIAASSALSDFGAKIPRPFFRMVNAAFLAPVFLAAASVLRTYLGVLVFFTVVLTVVFLVVVFLAVVALAVVVFLVVVFLAV